MKKLFLLSLLFLASLLLASCAPFTAQALEGMNFLQAVIFAVMLADVAKFIWDVESLRGKMEARTMAAVRVDGFIPINRRVIEMTRRQL